jgi:hypothetical protein
MLRCGVEVSGRFEQFKLTIGSGSFSPSEDSGYFLFIHGAERFDGFKCLFQHALAINSCYDN